MENKELTAIRRKLGHAPMIWKPTVWMDTKIEGLNAVLGHTQRGIPYGRVIEVFGWECLVGDTLIDTPRDLTKHPDGIPIRDLVGTKPWVYGYDPKLKRIVLRQASRVWKVGRRKVYKVTFQAPRSSLRKFYKQPECIIATETHPFLLRNGPMRGLDRHSSEAQSARAAYNWDAQGYCQLKDLKPGDRLMPLFRKASGNEQHESILYLNNGERVLEHRFILSETEGERPTDYRGHHKDENHLNNSIDNLEWMTTFDHQSHHATKRNLEGRSGWQKTGVHPRGMAGKHHSSKTKRSIAATLRKKAAALNHKVKSVAFYGYEDVYDMEVPGLNNFVANGVVVHNSQGKSSILLSLAALMQRDGAYIILGDIENSFEADYARARGLLRCPKCAGSLVLNGKPCTTCLSGFQEEPTGLDLRQLMVVKPYVGTFTEVNPKTGKPHKVTRLTNAQELCKEIEEAIQLKVKQNRKVVLLDSVTAMLTAGEAEAGLNGGMRSNFDLPMFMSKLLRRWIGLAKVHNTLIILVNQLRTGPKSFGNPEYTPGGNATKFYAHVRVQVQRVKGSRMIDKGRIIGIKGKLVCRKNKTGGTEGAEIGFRLLFKGGLEFVPVSSLQEEE